MAFDLFGKVKEQLSRTDIDSDNLLKLSHVTPGDQSNIAGIIDELTKSMPDIPPAVRVFLGQLSLLQGVPLYYLLPDERYLPKTVVSMMINQVAEPVEVGSIRLFRLDKEWIECLLDGAVSVGPDDDRKLLLAKAMAGNYAAEVFYNDTKEKIKKQLYGLYDPVDYVTESNKRLAAKNIRFLDTGQLKLNDLLVDNGQPMPTIAQSNWCYSGFFMRSTIIASWIGVEIVAEGMHPNNNNGTANPVRPLQVVRFERIAPDTIFCICEGMISQVQITQPQETVHFGVSESTGTYSVASSQVTMRNEKSVINITDLITDLTKKLGVTDAAKFADEMLSRPLKVTIDINWKAETAIA